MKRTLAFIELTWSDLRKRFRRPRRYGCDWCGRPAGGSFADPGFCSEECRDAATDR